MWILLLPCSTSVARCYPVCCSTPATSCEWTLTGCRFCCRTFSRRCNLCCVTCQPKPASECIISYITASRLGRGADSAAAHSRSTATGAVWPSSQSQQVSVLSPILLRVDLDGVQILLPHVLAALQLVLCDLPAKASKWVYYLLYYCESTWTGCRFCCRMFSQRYNWCCVTCQLEPASECIISYITASRLGRGADSAATRPCSAATGAVWLAS